MEYFVICLITQQLVANKFLNIHKFIDVKQKMLRFNSRRSHVLVLALLAIINRIVSKKTQYAHMWSSFRLNIALNNYQI